MFIPDMPNVPPQDVPVMIAQANQAQPGDVKTIRAIGVCNPVPNMPDSSPSAGNVIEPELEAKTYFRLYETEQGYSASATISVLQNPKHGALLDEGDGAYSYLPEKGYYGKDKAIMQVDFNGLKVNVVYFFQVVAGPLGNDGDARLCSKTGYNWKISSTLDSNGNSTITSVEYQSPIIDAGATSTDTAALASTLGASILSSLSVDPSLVTLNIADLPGGAVGQTVGTNITLDDNAAGNGWFIDTTPADNSEFLPTSDPNEWVARAGSDAAGKMDMLSVLLH